jgi:CRP/FNR family transcriptional regulator
MREFQLKGRAFRGVGSEALKVIMQHMEVRPFQRNELLWREGDMLNNLAVVLEGRVKRVKHRASGRDLIVDIQGPGQLVGLSAAQTTEPVSVVGLSQGAVAMLNRQAFLRNLRENNQLAFNLVMALAGDERGLFERFEEVTAGSVEARLASVFARLADDEGLEGPNGVFLPLPLSRQDLADLVDTTIETAIRIMSRWNRDGVVLTQRDGFLIPRLDELERRAA